MKGWQFLPMFGDELHGMCFQLAVVATTDEIQNGYADEKD